MYFHHIRNYKNLKIIQQQKMQQSYINYSNHLPPLAPSQIYLPNNYQPIQSKNIPLPYFYQPLHNASFLPSRYQNHEYQQRVIRKQSLQDSRNMQSSPKSFKKLQDSKLIVNPDRWNLQQENTLANPSNFPFGKDRIKLSDYVTQKIQSQDDQQNKRILQKFRIDAIKNRNQRVMKHLGKIPYITQSMMPGSSIDAFKYVENEQKAPSPQPQYRKNITPAPIMPVTYMIDPRYVYQQPKDKRVQTVGVSAYIPYQQPQKVLIPRKLGQSTSIGIQVNFQQQFPLKPYKKPLKARKKRGYTIQQQQQYRSINKIQSMIHQINKNLKKNSEMLQESLLQSVSLSHSRAISEKYAPTKRFRYSRRNYFPDLKNKELTPSVVYSVKDKKVKRSKTQISNQRQEKDINQKSFIKQHLQLLKDNRKRMEDLDQYVFKL